MEQKSNLSIQVLSILGGLLTAGFFIGFLVFIDATRSTTSCFIISTLLITTAVILSRTTSKPFLDAINITFYIAGCTLPFFTSSLHEEMLYISFVGISIITFLLSKGFMLPLVSVILFNVSLFAEISELTSYNPLRIAIVPIFIIFLLLNLFEDQLLVRMPEQQAKYKPLHAGFFVSTLFTLGGMSIFHDDSELISPFIWIGFTVLIQQVTQTLKVKSRAIQCYIYMMSLAVCLLTLYAPYLSGSLLLIFICFHYGYRKEFAASILLFIYTVSKFYYDLSLTLLVKSALLFFTGILLIVTWYFITQKETKHGKI